MSAAKLKSALQSAPIVQHWISGRVASSDGSRPLDVITQASQHVLRQEEPVTGHARPSRSDRAHITDLGCVKVSDAPSIPGVCFFWKRFSSTRNLKAAVDARLARSDRPIFFAG
jgi:hypothetical protein